MKNFVGNKPLGFAEGKKTFTEDTYNVGVDELIFGGEIIYPKENTDLVIDPKSLNTVLTCPEPQLPAPPPCMRYEKYFEPNQECPSYRLVKDPECADTSETTDITTTEYPNWSTMSCDDLGKAIMEFRNKMSVIKYGSDLAYQQDMDQLTLAEDIYTKTCTKETASSYEMLNWKSIGCDMIPSAINDLGYMIAQEQGTKEDLELMKRDVEIGREFYNTNCEKNNLWLDETKDVNTGTGDTGTGSTGTGVVETGGGGIGGEVTGNGKPVEVVDLGPAKKNYTWLYILAGVGVFLILTKRR